MMGNKPLALGLYATLLLGCMVVLPWVRRRAWFIDTASSPAAGLPPGKWGSGVALLLLCVIAVSTAGMVRRPELVLLVGIGAAAYAWSGFAGRMNAFWGFVLGAAVSLSLPWWMRAEGHWATLSTWQAIAFVAILAIVARVLARDRPLEAGPLRQGDRWVALTLTLSLGVLMVASTGMAWTQAIKTSWHHWGAYVGPAQLVLAGAVPLHDIPLQYGLGPTLLLTFMGHQGAWMALHGVAVLLTLLMMGLLCWLAMRLCRAGPRSSSILLCLILVWACAGWTAYPASLMSSLSTPSTTGIRFGPGVIMLATLAGLQWGQERGRPVPWFWGHVVWLLCACWSPEAGVQASIVWVPGFFWSRAVSPEGWQWSRARQAVWQLAFALAIGLLCFVTLFWLRWREWPLPSEYVAYLMHPPGPLPVSTKGTLRFAVVAFACWLWAMLKSDSAEVDRGTLRVAWAVGLLAMANFSYYLGRSHDNNILNLAAFIALMLMAAMRLAPARSFLHHLILVMLSSLLAWSVCFGYDNVIHAWRAGKLFEFDAQALVSSFDRQSPHSLHYLVPEVPGQILVPEDAAHAIEAIRRERHEPIETFDQYMVVDQGELLAPWNALHGPENFTYIPPQDRRRYLARVAGRLKSAGWVLFEQHADMSEFLADYDSVYRRTETLTFGSYTAIRYAP
jgi:hypothetical protein